jgi:OOP family OmpA-OmpF porin
MRRAAGLALAAVATTSTGLALAQEDIDAERFKPAVSHDGFITQEGSAVRPEEDRWELFASLSYGLNPLVVVDGNGDLVRSFVDNRLTLDVGGSVTIAGPFALGIDIPVYLVQTGDADPEVAGLGDIRLVPKLQILDDRDSVGLGVLLELRAPTHTGGFGGGARTPVVWPKIALDHRFAPSGLRMGLNVGVLAREGTTFANVEAASEFTYGGALGYRFGGVDDGPVELGAELFGGVGLAEQDEEELPLEADLYAKFFPGDEWEIFIGPGFGVVGGYGEPTFRVFAGFRFTPTSHDRDGDGVSDEDDECPDDAEDRDGDADGDGCPEEDPDSDVDGVPDSEDDCPDQKETINGFQDEDGCPDTGDPRVIYEDGEVKILDTVKFETGSATIKQESHSLLDQVALTLKANPDIKKVRVEGHTDETGSREVNMRLSKSRAESVRQYLVNRGVASGRLTAEGYGPDKPLASGADAESLAKNRRVEFIVEE